MRTTLLGRLLFAASLIVCLDRFLTAESRSVSFTQERTKQPPVILNIAADALVDYLRTKKPLEKGATQKMVIDGLHDMVDQYRGTNVTHLYFNVSYQRAAYQSGVWESYWQDVDLNRDLKGWPRKYWVIHQLKVNPFAVVIERCRLQKISPWVSIRMNDTHHLEDPARSSRLWREHPELRTREKGGFDFTHAEIQDHYLSLIKELVQRYDVDGIELDWMRYADNFKPKETRGKSQLLTNFMRKARQVVDAASTDRSRPLKISVRVPAKPDFAKGRGIDGVAWVQNGLVDILVPCSTWNPSYPDVPVESWRRAIGDTPHKFLLVPGTDLWISGGQRERVMSSNMETMRAFSLSMLDRGADGLYLFNHFARTDAKIWHLNLDGERHSNHVFGDLLGEVGSLKKSQGKPRRHILTNHDPIPPDSDYQRPLPARIGSQQSAELSIHLGPKPSAGRILVRVGLDDRPGFLSSKVTAHLNGTNCGEFKDLLKPKNHKLPTSGWSPVLNVAEIAPRVIEFNAPLKAVRRGYNSVKLGLTTTDAQDVVWLEILVNP